MTTPDDSESVDPDPTHVNSDTPAAETAGAGRGERSIRSLGEPLEAGLVLGRYEIIECIDSGGMGVVYRARHRSLGKVVALKVISMLRRAEPGVDDRFTREMQAIGCLDPHPNVLIAYDAGNEDGIQYIATELIDGIDLGTLVSRMGPLSVADASKITSQAAAGLEHLRRHNLVHRDIKPSNLMLTRDGVVKIVDMGLALLRDEQVERLTMQGEAMGSVDYIAPEQWRDSHEVDWRSDVYSLGCAFYCLLAGRAPYRDLTKNSFSKMRAHLQEPFPEIRHERSDVPDAAAQLLASMVRKSPDDRLTDLVEISRRLNLIASGDLRALAERGFDQREKQPQHDVVRKVYAAHKRPPQADSATEETQVMSPSNQPLQSKRDVSAAKATHGNWRRNLVAIVAVSLLSVALAFGWQHWPFSSVGVSNLPLPDGSDEVAPPTGEASPGASSDGSAEPQQVPEPRPVVAIKCIGHTEKVMGVTFLSKSRIASVDERGTLCIFDLADSRQPVHRVNVSNRAAASVVHDPQSGSLIVGCEDGTVQVRSASDGSSISGQRVAGAGLSSVALVPDSRSIVTTDWEGGVRLIGLEGRSMRNQLLGSHDQVVYDAAISADGKKLAWVGRTPNVTVLDIDSEREIDFVDPDMIGVTGRLQWIYAVAISPDGRRLASAGQDNHLRVWNMDSGKLEGKYESIVPQAIAFLDDSRHLAVGGRGGIVEILDLQRLEPIQTFPVGAPIDSIAIGPESRQVAAGAANGALKVWPLRITD